MFTSTLHSITHDHAASCRTLAVCMLRDMLTQHTHDESVSVSANVSKSMMMKSECVQHACVTVVDMMMSSGVASADDTGTHTYIYTYTHTRTHIHHILMFVCCCAVEMM